MGGYWTSFRYDANNNLSQVANPVSSWGFYCETADGLAGSGSIYPPPGTTMCDSSRITITNPSGGQEEYFYNPDNSVIWYVSPKNYVPYSSADRNNSADSVPKTTYQTGMTPGKPIRSSIGCYT